MVWAAVAGQVVVTSSLRRRASVGTLGRVRRIASLLQLLLLVGGGGGLLSCSTVDHVRLFELASQQPMKQSRLVVRRTAGVFGDRLLMTLRTSTTRRLPVCRFVLRVN